MLALIGAILVLTAGAQAEKPVNLKKHFTPLYRNFSKTRQTKIKILTGPRAVKMGKAQLPGRQWTATDGNYLLKLTIEDKAKFELDKLTALIEQLPSAYLKACYAVSGKGQEGVAVYAAPAGAGEQGGKSSIRIVPRTKSLTLAFEMGQTLVQVAERKDKTILDQWSKAIAADKATVSGKTKIEPGKDLGEFAQLYAVCLGAGGKHLAALQKLSPARFALWKKILGEPDPKAAAAVAAVKAEARKIPAWATKVVSKAQLAEAKRLDVPVAFVNGVGIKFVLIPSGTFMMGSAATGVEIARLCNMSNAQPGWFLDEHPRHKVTLTKAFYMSVHEITQEQYFALVKIKSRKGEEKPKGLTLPAGVSQEFRGADKPMIFVKKVEVDTYVKLLEGWEQGMGRTYSLPTEAQWEYACRAGTTTPFFFGKTISPKQANYDGRYTYGDGAKGTNRGVTTPVGQYPPNAWGLYDMHGNVSEWCSDYYGPYEAKDAIDPPGPPKPRNNERNVVRGGAWRSYPGACRSACRLHGWKGQANSHVGFRLISPLPGSSKTPGKK